MGWIDPTNKRRETRKTVLMIVVLGLMLAATSGDAGAPVAGVVTLGTTVEITQAVAVGNRASKIVGAPSTTIRTRKSAASMI
jgi:hypothetical protein